MEKRPAYFTYDEQDHAYYFAPQDRAEPPYLRQVRVTATIDVAADGTFAGIEIHDAAAPKPHKP